MNHNKENKPLLFPKSPKFNNRFPRQKRKSKLLNLLPENLGETDCEEFSSNSSIIPESASSNIGSEGNTENAFVYLRMKPVPKNEILSRYSIAGKTLITHHTETNVSNEQNSIEKCFTFTHIFDEAKSQEEIYDNSIRDKIKDEKSFTVLTYGTSGSGKTYTLLGTTENPGIIPRALENIFTKYSQNLFSIPTVLIKNGEIIISNDNYLQDGKRLRKLLLKSNAKFKKDYEKSRNKIQDENKFEEHPKENESIMIYCSFIELYNEIVYDLLSTNKSSNSRNNNLTKKSSNLKIMMNDGRVFIKDITSVFVKSSFEANQLLYNGLKRVNYASTLINKNSSRSHCIFIVDIIKHNDPDVFTHLSYKFCDLAGSERLGKTRNVETRLKETQQINKSLMVLGRCLDAVYQNQNKKITDIIPYRDSKLTMLLQASLNGREKIAMIVNITPTEEYFGENINVLSFASIARNIIYKQVAEKEEKLKEIRFSFLAKTVNRRQFEELWEENCRRRSDCLHFNNVIKRLEKLLHQQEIEVRKLVDYYAKETEKNTIKWKKKLQNTENRLKANEKKIEVLKAKYERKNKELLDYIQSYEEEIRQYKFQIEMLESNVKIKSVSSVTKRRRKKLDGIENYSK